jgi:hypothetical protein
VHLTTCRPQVLAPHKPRHTWPRDNQAPRHLEGQAHALPEQGGSSHWGQELLWTHHSQAQVCDLHPSYINSAIRHSVIHFCVPTAYPTCSISRHPVGHLCTCMCSALTLNTTLAFDSTPSAQACAALTCTQVMVHDQVTFPLPSQLSDSPQPVSFVYVCGDGGREVIRLQTDPENQGTGAYLLLTPYTHGGASHGM